MRIGCRVLPSCLWLALCLAVLPATQAFPQILVENFNDNNIDQTLWSVELYGTGPELSEAGEQLQIVVGGASSGSLFGADLISRFSLRGDFDMQVEFQLPTWPLSNGVRLGLAIYDQGLYGQGGVERISFGQGEYPGSPREAHLTHFLDGVQGITASEDLTGILRLVRTGAAQTGYFFRSGQWVPIHTGPASTADTPIRFHVWSHDYAFNDMDVMVAFDNFVITSGELVDWPLPVHQSSWGAVKRHFR